MEEIQKIQKPQPHAMEVKSVLLMFGSKPSGLSYDQARAQFAQDGPNEIEHRKPLSPIIVFFKQLQSALVYILLIAAIISYYFEHYIDVYVILFVVLVNATVGFLQEHKAQKATEALGKMVEPTARVFRDGKLTKIPAKNLVRGDVLFLEEGDKISADARVIRSRNFRAQESALTGESAPITKTTEAFDIKTVLADRRNMVWAGTLVVGGQARAVVVETGNATVLGTVARNISRIKPKKSHFQKKVDVLGRQMAVLAFFGSVATFIIGYYWRGMEFGEIFLATIATLVSSIPEGLPAILTIVLAVSSLRMAKKNAIIRSLPAIETLGIVSAIMTDKTGTLTQNTLNVRRLFLANGDTYTVTGNGWEPTGEFFYNNKPVAPLEILPLARLLHVAGVCNAARLINTRKKEESSEKEYSVIGDPTEGALTVLAEKSGLTKEVLENTETRLDDMPFQSDMQYRATLVGHVSGHREIYVAGAPERVLSESRFLYHIDGSQKMDEPAREKILKQVSAWSSEAVRVIAVAFRADVPIGMSLSNENINNLVFVGLVGMSDTPRPGVREAVLAAHRAGIRVLMTTGDHKETALAIAREVGLAENGAIAYTENELLEMDPETFVTAVNTSNVFARLTPKMKLRITKALQKQGDVVAVTGDGVNDALALTQADIGISMGKIGTDVARESSDIILADDNFATIVRVVEEGRLVFNNTRRAASFLVTTNFAENATVVGAIAMGFPLPLLPAQILWMNLISEGFPDIALTTEPSHGRALHSAPRDSNTNILSRQVIPHMILMVVCMMSVSIGAFAYFLDEGLEKARTAAFVAMALTQLFNVYNMRSFTHSAFAIGFFRNRFVNWAVLGSFLVLLLVIYVPPIGNLLEFTSLGFMEFTMIFILSSSVLWLGEARKWLKFGKTFSEKTLPVKKILQNNFK